MVCVSNSARFFPQNLHPSSGNLNFRLGEARKEAQCDDVCSQIFINSAEELVGWLDEEFKYVFWNHARTQEFFYALPTVDTRNFINWKRLLFSSQTINIRSSSFLTAYHHVNSHFVIHSFFLMLHLPSSQLVVHISAPKKSFSTAASSTQKCIMHCGTSQIMFQRAGNFHAKNDNSSLWQNSCSQSKSLHGTLRFMQWHRCKKKSSSSSSSSWFINIWVRKIILFTAFVVALWSLENFVRIITLWLLMMVDVWKSYGRSLRRVEDQSRWEKNFLEVSNSKQLKI